MANKRKLTIVEKNAIMKFYSLIKKDCNDSDHIIAELISFMLGLQKVFDVYDFSPTQEKILQEFSFFGIIIKKVEGRIFLVKKKNLQALDNYLKLRTAQKQNGLAAQAYGDLMGFPKTATDAWLKDYGKDVNDRSYLLNSYACRIIEYNFGHTLMPFIFSTNNWEEEYIFSVKRDLAIMHAVPDIFKEFFSRKNAAYLEYKRKISRKRKLVTCMHPVLKAFFYASKSKEFTPDEKARIDFAKYMVVLN